jgi:outer membrane protein
MRYVFLFVICLFTSTSNHAQEIYSLEQCIDLAWQNNLQVKQAELSLDASESQLNASRTNTLPNVNGFASHNYNWGQRIDPFTNQFATTRVQSNSFGLSSSVTLFNGFQNQQNIQAQQAGMESAMYDLETQKNNIALNVSAAYLQVVLIEDLIIAAEQQVNITERQLDRIKKMVEAGASNLGNQYELEAQLGRDRSNLTLRRNDYQIAKLQLKQLMMMPADETINLIRPQIDADSAIRLESAATVYGYAESTMPEIKSAERSLLSWEKQLGVAKSGYYPSLVLSGSIGSGYSGLRTEVESATQGPDQQIGFLESGEPVYTSTFDAAMRRVPFTTQLNDNFNQFVGLSLNVPIFNRYSVKNSVNQAKINQSIAELQLEQEKLGLRQRIETARADAAAARELYKANVEVLKSSQKSFEFAEVRFEAGALNVTEFNTAKNNLQIAQAQLSQSHYDFIFKTKVLDFYMGKPLGFEG